MTQKEFIERAGVVPTSEEFDYIHAVYMNTSMDKDEFCKDLRSTEAAVCCVMFMREL